MKSLRTTPADPCERSRGTAHRLSARSRRRFRLPVADKYGPPAHGARGPERGSHRCGRSRLRGFSKSAKLKRSRRAPHEDVLASARRRAPGAAPSGQVRFACGRSPAKDGLGSPVRQLDIKVLRSRLDRRWICTGLRRAVAQGRKRIDALGRLRLYLVGQSGRPAECAVLGASYE